MKTDYPVLQFCFMQSLKGTRKKQTNKQTNQISGGLPSICIFFFFLFFRSSVNLLTDFTGIICFQLISVKLSTISQIMLFFFFVTIFCRYLTLIFGVIHSFPTTFFIKPHRDKLNNDTVIDLDLRSFKKLISRILLSILIPLNEKTSQCQSEVTYSWKHDLYILQLYIVPLLAVLVYHFTNYQRFLERQ